MQRIFLSLNNFVGFSPNILGGIHVSWYLLWIFHNLSYVIPAGDIEEFYVFTAVELDRIREKIIPPTPRIVLVLSVMIRLVVAGLSLLKYYHLLNLGPCLVITGTLTGFVANAEWLNAAWGWWGEIISEIEQRKDILFTLIMNEKGMNIQNGFQLLQ